jgi:hypothetical protein
MEPETHERPDARFAALLGVLDNSPQADVACANHPGGRACQKEHWQSAVRRIRESPELAEDIIESIRTSMAFEGLEIERDRVAALLDLALAGPPLVYPDQE